MTQQNIATMQDVLNALNRDPDLQREFHKHLAAVVRNDDELRQDLRKEILTEELLQLPARFTRLEEDVSARFTRLEEDVSARFTHLEEDVSELKQDMAEVKGRLTGVEGRLTGVEDRLTGVEDRLTGVEDRLTGVEDRLTGVEDRLTGVEAGQARMSGQLSNIQGDNYENRAIEGSRRLVRRDLNMERAIILYASNQRTSAGFEDDFLIPAMRAGRIQRRQADELERADCIIRCENLDGAIICAVVEISMTVHEHDHSRAVQRAELFEQATGLRTLPYVVGIDQEAPDAGAANATFLEYRPE